MHHPEGVDLFPRSSKLIIKIHGKLQSTYFLAAPSHKQHMSNLTRPMEEISHSQVDCSLENRYGGPLRFLEDTIYRCFIRHLFPESVCCPLSNNRVAISDTNNLERCPRRSRPTISQWSALMIQVFIQLLIQLLD